MYRIRRFAVMKTATVVAVMYIIGVAIFAIPAALIVGVAGTSGGGANVGAGVGGVLIFALLAAVLYGIVGWVFTAIFCAIYNLAAGWVGGIQVQVETVIPPGAAPVWGPPPSAPAVPPGSSTSVPSQTGWTAPPSSTDTAPYDPRAPRND